MSSGAQKEDDIANEGKCKNENHSSNDRSSELVDDSKSPEAKKSKYENSTNSVCQIDDNLEEDIGIFMIIRLSFLLYSKISNVRVDNNDLVLFSFQRYQLAVGVEYLLDNILTRPLYLFFWNHWQL